MNLFDLPEKELFDIKEVGLVLRDIAFSRIPNRRLSSSNQCIYSTEDFEVLLIANNVVLKKNYHGGYELDTSFALAANYDKINDYRPWSTRYNTDIGRYAIRTNCINSIIKLNVLNVFFNTIQGDEEYIGVINETTNYSDMEPEIFQRALIESTDEMNVIMLNYLFRRDLTNQQTDQCITLHGYLSELELISKAVPHIQELCKLC